MRFARLVVHRMTREPLALLVEEDADRCLVVSVRAPQAEVIDRGPRAAEPSDDDRMTQDLLADLAGLLGRRLDRGEIVDLVDDRFKAELVLDDGTRLPGRPSDVLAVAVREALRIEVADAVLDAVGQSFSELGGDRPEPAREAAEQVEQMREFLEEATAQDFARPPDGGEGRDPGRSPG
ncbi:bifunctional nuclease domain-containing protein [Actinomycetospora sp. NBRC 106375]|uniref:bifunctional nuclease domain-containing protein n=1 Tax=Actinomycetospora sp. NBRC 106375 TaxID=3032207 RepID=UPI0025542D7C|nr:bifunctional nuclease domain-containing protein [Actinomycetospora sp. NBRC 106375]